MRKVTRVREGKVGLAGQREIRVELNGVANVHDDQERGPAFRRGQGLGVALGLAACGQHCLVPTMGATDCRAALQSCAFGEEWGCRMLR